MIIDNDFKVYEKDAYKEQKRFCKIWGIKMPKRVVRRFEKKKVAK